MDLTTAGNKPGIRLYYYPGEDIVNGVITINLEGFTAKHTDYYHDGRWNQFNASNVDISNNGSTVTIKDVTFNAGGSFDFQFDGVAVTAGSHTLTVVADADGDDGTKLSSNPSVFEYIAN